MSSQNINGLVDEEAKETAPSSTEPISPVITETIAAPSPSKKLNKFAFFTVIPQDLTLPTETTSDKKFLKECQVCALSRDLKKLESDVNRKVKKVSKKRRLSDDYDGGGAAGGGGVGDDEEVRQSKRFKISDEDYTVVFNNDISVRSILLSPNSTLNTSRLSIGSNNSRTVSFSCKDVIINESEVESGADDDNDIDNELPRKQFKVEKEAHPNKTSPHKIEQEAHPNKLSPRKRDSSPSPTRKSDSPEHKKSKPDKTKTTATKDGKKGTVSNGRAASPPSKFKFKLPSTLSFSKRKVQLPPPKKKKPIYISKKKLVKKFGKQYFKSFVKLNTINNMDEQLSMIFEIECPKIGDEKSISSSADQKLPGENGESIDSHVEDGRMDGGGGAADNLEKDKDSNINQSNDDDDDSLHNDKQQSPPGDKIDNLSSTISDDLTNKNNLAAAAVLNKKNNLKQTEAASDSNSVKENGKEQNGLNDIEDDENDVENIASDLFSIFSNKKSNQQDKDAMNSLLENIENELITSTAADPLNAPIDNKSSENGKQLFSNDNSQSNDDICLEAKKSLIDSDDDDFFPSSAVEEKPTEEDSSISAFDKVKLL